MRREKTTLQLFGGGVDPSAVEPDDGDEVRARRRFVKLGRDRTITDLGVRLERDLVERLDPQLLKTGEERRRLRLSPQQAGWIDAMYIYAEPTDENEKFDQVVRQPDGYPTVGMPRAWLRNEVVNEINNPFHNAGPDDHVVVRYLPEGAIEIYPEEVFNAHPHFVRLRAATPFAVLSSDDLAKSDCYNLAAFTPYNGQMFEIISFDLSVFNKDIQDNLERSLFGSGRIRLTPDEFTRILAEGDIKPCPTSVIQIHWGTELTPQQEILFLERENTARLRVVLPAHGIVHISTYPVAPRKTPLLIHQSYEHRITDSAVEGSGFSVTDENGTSYINQKYLTRINDQWWGRFFDVPENGPPIIYVPVDPKSEFSASDPHLV